MTLNTLIIGIIYLIKTQIPCTFAAYWFDGVETLYYNSYWQI